MVAKEEGLCSKVFWLLWMEDQSFGTSFWLRHAGLTSTMSSSTARGRRVLGSVSLDCEMTPWGRWVSSSRTLVHTGLLPCESPSLSFSYEWKFNWRYVHLWNWLRLCLAVRSVWQIAHACSFAAFNPPQYQVFLLFADRLPCCFSYLPTLHLGKAACALETRFLPLVTGFWCKLQPLSKRQLVCCNKLSALWSCGCAVGKELYHLFPLQHQRCHQRHQLLWR